MQRRFGHVGNGYNFPLFTDKVICGQAKAECGKLSTGTGSVDCGSCPAGSVCVANKCKAEGFYGVKETCAAAGAECGVIPWGMGTLDCGACPQGKSCSKNKCTAPVSLHTTPVQTFRSNTSVAPLLTDQKVAPPIFADQPLIQSLLVSVTDKVAALDIPDTAKTMESVAAWIKSKNWKTIYDAAKWAGLQSEVDSYLARCDPKLLVNPVWASKVYLGEAACKAEFEKIFNQLVDKCVEVYQQEIPATVELEEQQEQQGGDEIPPQEEKSNALLWVLGIGAVLAAGGAAVYFAQKPSTNPAERTSGYKKLESALVQALKLARKDREEKYVVPRSDGFHILPHKILPRDKKTGMLKDRENWVVLPNNNYLHWFNGSVVDSGPIE